MTAQQCLTSAGGRMAKRISKLPNHLPEVIATTTEVATDCVVGCGIGRVAGLAKSAGRVRGAIELALPHAPILSPPPTLRTFAKGTVFCRQGIPSAAGFKGWKHFAIDEQKRVFVANNASTLQRYFKGRRTRAETIGAIHCKDKTIIDLRIHQNSNPTEASEILQFLHSRSANIFSEAHYLSITPRVPRSYRHAVAVYEKKVAAMEWTHEKKVIAAKQAYEREAAKAATQRDIEVKRVCYKTSKIGAAVGITAAVSTSTAEAAAASSSARPSMQQALGKLTPVQKTQYKRVEETVTARLNREGVKRNEEAKRIMRESGDLLTEVIAQRHARGLAELAEISNAGFAIASVMHQCGASKQATGLVTAFSGLVAMSVATGPAGWVAAGGAVLAGIFGMWDTSEGSDLMSRPEMLREFDEIKAGIVKATLYLEEHMDKRFDQLDQKMTAQYQSIMKGLQAIFLAQNAGFQEINENMTRQYHALSEKFTTLQEGIQALQDKQAKEIEKGLRREYGHLQSFSILETLDYRRLVGHVRMLLGDNEKRKQGDPIPSIIRDDKEFDEKTLELRQAIVAESVGDSDIITGKDIDLTNADDVISERILYPFFKGKSPKHIASSIINALLRYAHTLQKEGSSIVVTSAHDQATADKWSAALKLPIANEIVDVKQFPKITKYVVYGYTIDPAGVLLTLSQKGKTKRWKVFVANVRLNQITDKTISYLLSLHPQYKEEMAAAAKAQRAQEEQSTSTVVIPEQAAGLNAGSSIVSLDTTEIANPTLLCDRAFAFLDLYKAYMEAHDNQLSQEAFINLRNVIEYLEGQQALLEAIDQKKLFDTLKLKATESLRTAKEKIQMIMSQVEPKILDARLRRLADIGEKVKTITLPTFQVPKGNEDVVVKVCGYKRWKPPTIGDYKDKVKHLTQYTQHPELLDRDMKEIEEAGIPIKQDEYQQSHQLRFTSAY